MMRPAKLKLVKDLTFIDPFWIARFGDYIYLFNYPNGFLLGKLFAPRKAD